MNVLRANLAGIAVAAGMVLLFSPVPLFAQEIGGTRTPSEMSAQERPRPRIRVQPQPQPPAWDFPRPDTYSWPAPAPAYRLCEDWYQTEYRASGTVITPQKRCRWVRG